MTVSHPQDYFYTHRDRLRFLYQRLKSLVSSHHPRLLDIGCYPPYLLEKAQKLGFQIRGIASQHEPITGPLKKYVVHLNIEKDRLPFKSNFFDLILLTEVLEHLPHSPLFPLQQIKRVLKPKGLLIITTPNAGRLASRLLPLLGKNTYPPLKQLINTPYASDNIYHRHHKEYTRRELKRLISLAGFKIVKLTTITAYTPFRPRPTPDRPILTLLKMLNFIITYLAPPLRDTLYLEATV